MATRETNIVYSRLAELAKRTLVERKLLTPEMLVEIAGDDEYTEIVVDAYVQYLSGVDGEELRTFIYSRVKGGMINDKEMAECE